MNIFLLWFHKMGSPPTFYKVAKILKPWFLIGAILTGAIALYLGVISGPADYLQGESVRIMYIHVPSAWMSMFIYVAMAISGIVALVWRIKIAEIAAMCMAPIGAMFTAVTLITGALWGRPTWGTYWVWDARLTSELLLLFLYFGVIGLYRAIEDPRTASRTASLLAIVGLINIPIVHFSVKWWNTLHQGESIKFIGKSSMDPSMLWPLLIMAIATKLYFAWSLLNRMQTNLIELEGNKDWVRNAGLVHTSQTQSDSENGVNQA